MFAMRSSSCSQVSFALLFLNTILQASWALPQPAIAVGSGDAGSPRVTMASGVVIGRETNVPNHPDLRNLGNVYQGIPFAKSPPLRFAPPEAAPAWQDPLLATKRKPACIQQFPGPKVVQDAVKLYFNNPLGPAPEESEDCLYLDIYTPTNVTTNSKKPVMFWLYGGNLMFGTGSLDFYDGTSLAVNQDVVVVTMNYRTNIFGFSNSPDLPVGSQNAGYLDQRFALRWVHDNIAAFGGDPDKVMVFGQSAGGESVRQLLANPPQPQLFHSAIMESAGAVLIGDGLANYNRVLYHFSCDNLDCLRKVPAVKIKDFIETYIMFFPPVQDDGTSMKDVGPAIKSGKFAKVPVLVGSTNNEIAIFSAVVASTLGIATAGATGSFFDKIATNVAWGCAASRQANILASDGYPVWRYRYDAGVPEVPLFAKLGAFHTAEIPAIFGNYPQFKGDTELARQYSPFSAFMQSVWAGFARNPAAGPGWPKVGSADGKELGVLGASGANLTIINTAEVDSCGLANGFAGLVGITR